jgi:hypothetical protein
MVRVDEDTSRRASRLDQSEATRRHAILEQPLSFAETGQRPSLQVVAERVSSNVSSVREAYLRLRDRD